MARCLNHQISIHHFVDSLLMEKLESHCKPLKVDKEICFCLVREFMDRLSFESLFVFGGLYLFILQQMAFINVSSVHRGIVHVAVMSFTVIETGPLA